MEESKLPSTEVTPRALVKLDFFALSYQEKLTKAVEIAEALSDIIEKKKLYSVIGGNKHINIEGWSSLGTMVNVVPVEEYVHANEDGSFEAKVKLIDMNGCYRGEGSAICGTDEPNWKNQPRFARRSMAITRATGKAYRTTLAWIPALKGYAGTPAEEMDFLTTDVSHGTLYEQACALAARLKDENMRKNALQFIEINKSVDTSITKLIKRMEGVLK